MKILSFISFCSILFMSGCLTLTKVQFMEEDNYVEVFDDLQDNKHQLYLKANNWIIQAFNDAESVIQHSDKEEGVVIGKYLMSGTVQSNMYGSVDNRVYAIIDIRVKDHKARLEIKPQGQWSYDPSGMSIYNYSKEDAINDMKRLSDDFYNALLKDNVEF